MLATINDKKLATDDGNGEVAYYEADVVTANDYYPFGMIMPGRKLPENENYRYGFNGQERSAEIDPNGNSMTAEFWQYDARLGRRWNMDPKPNIRFSPYSVFEDNPIWHTDIRGDTVSPRPTPVRVGTMSYYIDRVKDFQKRNPGAKIPEYYLGYGNVYINKFKNEIKQTLSGAGQEWLEKALVNLQTAIEDKLQSPKLEDRNLELNNKKFTDFAFGSHVKAYEDAGVLQLPIMDKVKIGLTPKAEDLFSDRGLAQAGQIAKDQAWYYLTHPIFALEQFGEVINNKDEIKARVHNYYLENKPFFDRKMEQNPQHWSNPEYRIMGIVRDIINPSFIF